MKRAFAAATEPPSVADVLMAKASSSKKKQELSDDEKAAKALLNKLTKQAISKIRKAGHTGPNKPLTTISLGIPSRAIGELALGRHGTITSDTKRMQRHDDISCCCFCCMLTASAEGERHPVVVGVQPRRRRLLHGQDHLPRQSPRDQDHRGDRGVVVTVEANMLTVKFKTWYDQNRSWREHMKAMDDRKATREVETEKVKKPIYTAPCGMVEMATEGASGASGGGVEKGVSGGDDIDAQHPMLFPQYSCWPRRQQQQQQGEPEWRGRRNRRTR